MSNDNSKTCFVIMPIGELGSYPADHFRHVYEDLFKPAIEAAGFEAKRADDDKSSNMINVQIVKDIISAPMAICDLSTRNPNVLYELGIRQAFDMPTVLVQEAGTPRIFDISVINTIDYRNSLIYREVMEDREKISEAIKATSDNADGLNSIIKMLAIERANIGNIESISDQDEMRMILHSIHNRVDQLASEIKNMKKRANREIHSLSVSEGILKDLCMDPAKLSKRIIDLSQGDRQMGLKLADACMDYIKRSNMLSELEKEMLLEELKEIYMRIDWRIVK